MCLCKVYKNDGEYDVYDEFDVYDGFSKRFVDSIKLCMANIIGTFLQSYMSEFRFIPLRRRYSVFFWY